MKKTAKKPRKIFPSKNQDFSNFKGSSPNLLAFTIPPKSSSIVTSSHLSERRKNLKPKKIIFFFLKIAEKGIIAHYPRKNLSLAPRDFLRKKYRGGDLSKFFQAKKNSRKTSWQRPNKPPAPKCIRLCLRHSFPLLWWLLR